MSNTRQQEHGKWWLYVGMVLMLIGCLWTGWNDFDPVIPQAEVRESIRSGIRSVIQLFLQYVMPTVIIIFLAGQIAADYRASKARIKQAAFAKPAIPIKVSVSKSKE